MADGAINFSTKLDNSQLEKDLAKATKDVDRLESQLLKNKEKRLPISEQVADLGTKLDEAKAKMAALQAESKEVTAAVAGANANDPASVAAYADAKVRQPTLKKEIVAAEKATTRLQGQFDRAAAKLDGVDNAAKRLESDLQDAKSRAGAIADELAKPATAGDRMGEAISHADERMAAFTHRLAGLAKRVFIFTIITKALRAIRDLMAKYVMANSEAAQAMAQLKGALLTLAQPLLSVIIPAFTALANILTRAVTAIANLLSLLFGKTIDGSKKAAKSMYNEAKAISAAGAAAEEASGSLASFDEINQLSDNSGGGGGGAAAAAAAANAPDFDFDTSTMQADLEKLLGWIKLIGSALLAWKLSGDFLAGFNTFVGLILAANGAIELTRNAWDAWQNGLTWDDLKGMLEGATELALGLLIAFGNVGLAVGFLVGGLVILATSFRDAMENGWNLQNLLGSISGLLMGGLGISVLTGSWIPLLIGGIGAALLALTVATGHGEELLCGIQKICQGFVDFITGIFSGDIDKALSGVSEMFKGLHGIVDAVVDGLRDSILSFLTWLDEKTGGKFHDIIEGAKTQVVAFFDGVKEWGSLSIDALKDIFYGLVNFVAGVFTNDWGRAWEGVKSIFKGIINGIIAVFEGMLNAAIGGFNNLSRALKKFAAFKLPDWMGGYEFKGFSFPTISNVRLPRLATGAVIPPNREFMAILGDQRHGNNIEAPEDLIRKIVREESRSNYSDQLLREILDAIREGKVLMVGKKQLGEVVSEALANRARARGAAAIPVV